MHFSTLLTLTLTAATSLISAQTPPRNKEFGVGFQVRDAAGNATILSAIVVRNKTTTAGQTGVLYLVGRSQNQYAGDPAYFNGTNPNVALDYDLTRSSDASLRGIYGASVPDLGSAYGNVGSVSLTKGYQDFTWSVYDREIYHKLYSGFNAFFACQLVINKKTEWVLSFGVYNRNSSPPAGCQSTKVVQLYIPGGELPPSPPPPTSTSTKKTTLATSTSTKKA